MSVVLVVAALTLLARWLAHRAKKRSTLAGLNADRPQHVVLRESAAGEGPARARRGSQGNL